MSPQICQFLIFLSIFIASTDCVKFEKPHSCPTFLNKDDVTEMPYSLINLFGQNHSFPKESESIEIIKVRKIQQSGMRRNNPAFRSTEPEGEPDKRLILSHFKALDDQPRFSQSPFLHTARAYLEQYFVDLVGNKNVYLQEVCFTFIAQDLKGANIVARIGDERRQAIVIGAHYDTLPECLGIDDNTSGVIAVLELCRLLTTRKHLFSHVTIYCVLFDFEEKGLIGSQAFVNEFLVHKAFNGVEVLGVITFDMILNYDPNNGTQEYYEIIEKTNPKTVELIKQSGSKGDFIAIFSRDNYETEIVDYLQESFSSLRPNVSVQLHEFSVKLDLREPSETEREKLGLFILSDHASFWYPNIGKEYGNKRFTFQTVLLTDTGPQRGLQRECYHQYCDDHRQLAEPNLQFYMTAIATAFKALEKLIESAKQEEPEATNTMKTIETTETHFHHSFASTVHITSFVYLFSLLCTLIFMNKYIS